MNILVERILERVSLVHPALISRPQKKVAGMVRLSIRKLSTFIDFLMKMHSDVYPFRKEAIPN